MLTGPPSSGIYLVGMFELPGLAQARTQEETVRCCISTAGWDSKSCKPGKYFYFLELLGFVW